MKTAGVKLDLENDTAIIMGKEIALNLTSSGHYCIPIDKNEKVSVENVCSVRLDEMDNKKRYDTLLKLQTVCTSAKEKVCGTIKRCRCLE